MKRIIVDFDDTLSFTKNRKWDDAEPNVALIEKLNGLASEGWIIDIFTARGSISCATREEAELKYGKQIRKWCKKHGLMYNELSFDKPLGEYYIDDKGITPESFLELDLRQLEGGFSGSDLYTDGKSVTKDDENVKVVIEWFNHANKHKHLHTPEITKRVGTSYTMDYIHHNEREFIDRPEKCLGLISEKLEAMKSMDKINDFRWEDYYTRLRAHLDGIDFWSEEQKEAVLEDFEHCTSILSDDSFYHGDFGIKNLLFTADGDVVLIDPINHAFGTVELDAAKFCASLIINNYPHSLYNKSVTYFTAMFNISRTMLTTLILCEMIRVYKYHPHKNKYKNILMEIHDDQYERS